MIKKVDNMAQELDRLNDLYNGAFYQGHPVRPPEITDEQFRCAIDLYEQWMCSDITEEAYRQQIVEVIGNNEMTSEEEEKYYRHFMGLVNLDLRVESDPTKEEEEVRKRLALPWMQNKITQEEYEQRITLVREWLLGQITNEEYRQQIAVWNKAQQLVQNIPVKRKVHLKKADIKLALRIVARGIREEIPKILMEGFANFKKIYLEIDAKATMKLEYILQQLQLSGERILSAGEHLAEITQAKVKLTTGFLGRKLKKKLTSIEQQAENFLEGIDKKISVHFKRKELNKRIAEIIQPTPTKEEIESHVESIKFWLEPENKKLSNQISDINIIDIELFIKQRLQIKTQSSADIVHDILKNILMAKNAKVLDDAEIAISVLVNQTLKTSSPAEKKAAMTDITMTCIAIFCSKLPKDRLDKLDNASPAFDSRGKFESILAWMRTRKIEQGELPPLWTMLKTLIDSPCGQKVSKELTRVEDTMDQFIKNAVLINKQFKKSPKPPFIIRRKDLEVSANKKFQPLPLKPSEEGK